MRDIYKVKGCYEAFLQCDICGDTLIEVVKATDYMDAQDKVFKATDKKGWRWFGGFHKCKECISTGKNYARGKNYEH